MRLFLVALIPALFIGVGVWSVSPSEVKPTISETYAWAPVPGATGYRVALYKGNSRVFYGETSEPTAAISAPAGTYHWYVWRLGSRQAIVSSNLLIG